MKCILVVLACCFLASPCAGQVVLEIDSNVDQSKIDFELWNKVIVPLHDRISRPYARPALKLVASSMAGAYCGIISLGPTGSTSPVQDLHDDFYRWLTHEYGHAKQCPTVNWVVSDVATGQIEYLLTEGEAEALYNATYRELNRADPKFPFLSEALVGKSLQNLPLFAAGGGTRGFLYQPGPYNYGASAFVLEQALARMPGHDFSAFFTMLGPGPYTLAHYLQSLDGSVSGKIDGRLPSTNIFRSPYTFFDGPDGTYFSVLGASLSDPALNTARLFSDGVSVINPDRIVFTHFWKSKDVEYGAPQGLPITGLYAVIRNPDGRQIEVFGEMPGIVAKGMEYPMRAGAAQLATWPEGAYRVDGCFRKDGACDPQLSEFAYFILYRKPALHNKMFLITTGPDYSELQPETNIKLTLPPGATVEYYPHLIVINGSEGDVLATDGVRNRIFTFTGDASIVNYFVDRFQPYLRSVANSASFNAEGSSTAANTVTPGAMASLFTWGATDRDPESVQAFGEDGKLPTEMCKDGIERTKVVFTLTDGREFYAPFFYCSQLQLNVQVPFELRGSSEAAVAIDFNGKRSNSVKVSIAPADPGIFKIFDSRGFGAIIHADGSLVDEQRPAQAGQTLALYATGLGTLTPDFLESGKPAPLDRLYETLVRPEILIAGTPCDVSFSGLAPGAVGLYQVNFKVPSGLPSGPQKLLLKVGGQTSNTVNLFVR